MYELYDWIKEGPIGLWSRRAHHFLQHASAVSSSFGLTRLFNPTIFYRGHKKRSGGLDESEKRFERTLRDLPRASSSLPLPCQTSARHTNHHHPKTKTSDREGGRVSLTRPYTKLTRPGPYLLTLPADLPTCNHLHRPLTSALFPILFFN